MQVKIHLLDAKKKRETSIKICLRVFRNQKQFIKRPATKPAEGNYIIIEENSLAYEVFIFCIFQYSFLMQGFLFESKVQEALIPFQTFRQYFVTSSYCYLTVPKGLHFHQRKFSSNVL